MSEPEKSRAREKEDDLRILDPLFVTEKPGSLLNEGLYAWSIDTYKTKRKKVILFPVSFSAGK